MRPEGCEVFSAFADEGRYRVTGATRCAGVTGRSRNKGVWVSFFVVLVKSHENDVPCFVLILFLRIVIVLILTFYDAIFFHTR